MSSSRPRTDPRFQKNPLESYSDGSSAYWPPGWNWTRFSAADDDIFSLDESELTKMREGLKAVLGEDGFDEMMRHVGDASQKHSRRVEREKAIAEGRPASNPKFYPPDWLKRWEKRYRGQTWGFLGFRTALYAKDGDDESTRQELEGKWEEFKARIEAALAVHFDWLVERYDGFVPDTVGEAREKFEIRWVENPELSGASADTLRSRFQDAIASLEPGMQTQLFLCASPKAVESVLTTPDDDFPTVHSRLWREEAPHLLAVMVYPGRDKPGDGDEDVGNPWDWYKAVFPVAVEVLPSELWETMEWGPDAEKITRQVRGSDELGGAMPENQVAGGLWDIWWGMGPSPRTVRRRAVMRGTVTD